MLFTLFPQSACAPTAPPPTQNIIITVPQGTSNHGNQKLLCTPSKWTDIATFFLANFVAHAATVKSLPGESKWSASLALILALLFPASGVYRGIIAIRQRAVLADTPLKTAARAGALCMVVRTSKWRPQTGNVVEVLDYVRPYRKPDFVFKTTKGKKVIEGDEWDWTRIDHVPAEVSGRSEKFEMIRVMLLKFLFRQILRRKEQEQEFSEVPALVFRGMMDHEARIVEEPLRDRKISGVCQLPEGYALAVLPPGARVNEHQFDGKALCTSELSSNYNLPKVLAAIFQTLYASATLYRVRGDQIQRYGFAAFGLTVAPYLVMSIVNLISTLLTPEYSAMYLVSSEAMKEAQRREGSRFEGVVGSIGGDRTSHEVFEKVKFEVNDSGRILMLGSDLGCSSTDSTEVVMATRGPPVNFDTGKFSDSPHLRFLYRLLNQPNRPFLLIPRSSEYPSSVSNEVLRTRWYTIPASLAVASIPVVIIGALSHFQPGQSTHAQRVWTMMWLAFGIGMGPFLGDEYPDGGHVFRMFLYLTPSIGGFVVVGQMLMEYGYCIQL